MRRRRGRASAVSLFAFQDVMASVIGILFFVVLMMALDTVTRKTTVSGSQIPPEPEVQRLRESLDAELREIRRLEAEAQASMEFVAAAGDPNSVLAQIEQSRQELEGLYDEIGRKQDALGKATDQKGGTARELREQEAKLRGLERRLEELRERAGTGVTRPRVSYIVDRRGDRLQPWLVEMSSESIRVGAKDGTSAAFTFDASAWRTREEQFLAWARVQNKATHYFVFLVKPSGIDNAREIMMLLRELGFDMGFDLLPETWIAFD